MNTSVRSCLFSGVAVIGVSGLVLTAVIPQQEFVDSDDPAVTLTAQVQPLPAPVIGALASPLALIDRQATFHIELFVDFLATGAELFGRIPPIAATLLQDIGTGASLPAAVGRALRDFADVEFDAGRELVGFAEDWASFQIQFVRDLVAGLPAGIGAGPFGQLVTAALDVAAEIVEGVVAFANAVITGAEAVVGDVLGDDAQSIAPTPAVVATAEPTAAPGPEPAALRTVPPQVADDDAEDAEDFAFTEDVEPSDESGMQREEASEDPPVAAATTVKQPGLPRSVAELRDTLTNAAGSARDEERNERVVDAPDAGSDDDHADAEQGDSAASESE